MKNLIIIKDNDFVGKMVIMVIMKMMLMIRMYLVDLDVP